MPPLHPDALWRQATQQWAEITAKSPDLRAAVRLQQRLLRLILDASASLDDRTELSLTPAAITDKWKRGLPAMRNETVPIPPVLEGVLPHLCAVLAEGGAGDSARHIGDAIAAKDIDAASLLGVSLARNQAAIRTSALHMGFSPDLLWLIGELGSSPLAHHLSSSIDDGRSTIWDRGYCPFCGSWPAFIEVIDGARVLRCSYCALGWPLHLRRCIYCGNVGHDFVAAAPDVSQPEKRVELCGSCSGYTKVVEVNAPTPFPLLAVEDLATMSLDRGAMERGYRRPEMLDLDTIEPRKSTC